MRFRGMSRIRHSANLLLSRVRGRAAILLYHRIARHVPDPQLLCVSPENFAAHLGEIKKRYNVMSLADLRRAMRSGGIPKRTVILTFDDGYVDNLWHAKPILERYDCPATVFIVSGSVGSDRELLSDELERIVLLSRTLPRSLSLPIGARTCQWQLNGEGSQEIAWDITDRVSPSSRHTCYREVHRALKPVSHDERQVALEALWQWANGDPSCRRDRRIMNASELSEIANDGLVDIGAHSVNHLVLASRPIAEQREEIHESRTTLERILNRRVSAFAYPYGDVSSMSAETVSLVREAGFELACANIPGLVNTHSDQFQLPRYLVRNWSGRHFARKLNRFFLD
jgi:peptidoglycan/xylan/chitin deacetylase (PgdA/CDA1 family)